MTLSIPNALLSHANGWHTDAALVLRALMETPFPGVVDRILLPDLPPFEPAKSPKPLDGAVLSLTHGPYRLRVFKDHSALLCVRENHGWALLPTTLALAATLYLRTDSGLVSLDLCPEDTHLRTSAEPSLVPLLQESLNERMIHLHHELRGVPGLEDPRVHPAPVQGRFAPFQAWPDVSAAVRQDLTIVLTHVCAIRALVETPLSYVTLFRNPLPNPLKPLPAPPTFGSIAMRGNERDKPMQRWLNALLLSNPSWLPPCYRYAEEKKRLCHFQPNHSATSSHDLMHHLEVLTPYCGSLLDSFPGLYSSKED
jgi:hypothetical protein